MPDWHNVPADAYTLAVSAAQRILIGYGTLILAVGFLLGTVLGAVRMKAPQARNLAMAHVETLMQSAMVLGLAFVMGAVGFRSTTATWAAVLLVIGSIMQATGVTLNWITGTEDQFAERSPGFRLNSVSTFVMWPALVLLLWGILTRL
jgi:hypothetical protein